MKLHLPTKLYRILLAYLAAMFFCPSVLAGIDAAQIDFQLYPFSDSYSAQARYYDNYSGWNGGVFELEENETFSNYSSIKFTNNNASFKGGAIWLNCYRHLNIHNNGNILFDGNSAHTGGAIYSENDATISLTENDRVIFTNNQAISNGCILCYHGILNVNDNTEVVFSENISTEGPGGAIDASASSLYITGNGRVEFTKNHAAEKGGAVFLDRNGSVNIYDNESVIFRQNYESRVQGSSTSYILRSIYMQDCISLTLQAGVGQNITLYDSIFVSAGTSVTFNSNYKDTAGTEQRATGDIVFSGRYAAEDLKELKSNYTKQELTDSLTSDIYATTYLYGGRLCIEDGAIYRGEGICIVDGSEATLRLANSTLRHSGYSVELESSTTLQAQGVNQISATILDMKDGSTLAFILGEGNRTKAAITLDGIFSQDGYLNITLENDGTMISNQRYALLQLNSGMTPISWNPAKVTLSGGDTNVNHLSWSNGVLYYTSQNVLPGTAPTIWAGGQGMAWNASDKNWQKNGLTCAYEDGVDVEFRNAGTGTISLVGTLTPKCVIVENGSGHDYIWSGSGKLSGGMSLSKSGEGDLTINTANTYTGGTSISGGTLHVGNKSALGTGTVTLAGGTLEVAAGGFANTITASGNSALSITRTALALGKAISNSGTLTLNGSFNASSLTLTQGEATHVDVNGNTGASGFAKSSGYSVTLVSGGSTVNNGATVTHGSLPGGLTLTLGTDGKATAGGSVDYSSYLLTGSDTAATSAIHAKGTGATVTQQGGTLTVDDAATVNSTGGTIKLTQAVTLGGSISNAAVTASAGTISATMSGSTTLTTSGNVTLSGAKTYTGMTTVNSGTLTLGGGLKSDVTINGGTLNTGSGLTLSNGQDILLKSGSISGNLTTAAGSSLTISPSSASVNGTLTLGGGTLNLDDNILNVSGALTLNSRTTLTVSGSYGYGDHTLITAGSINGSTDYLTVSGIADGWEIKRQGNSLILSIVHVARDIDFPKGGTWVNDGRIYSDGDNVTFTDSGKVTVSGTVKPGRVTVQGSGSTTWSGNGSVAGNAALVKTGSGKLTINTANSFSGGTGITQGTLRAGNKAALGTGTVQLSGGTLEIAARGIANTISVSGNSAITVASGTTHELTNSISNTGTLMLKGAIDASALKLTHDGVTHIDVNGNTGDSGFTKTGGASVTIVSGGTTKNGGTTITHKGLAAGETLVLGSNGKAVSGGTVDYATYVLTGTASAGLEAITKMAGKKLQRIDMQGGRLDIAAAKGATLAKGVTLDMDGGTVSGLLIVGTGSTLKYSGGSFTIAPELKGGTLDMGAMSSITVTGSKASVTLGKQNVSVTAKGTVFTDSDLDVTGGTVTLTALSGYKGDLVAEGGSTLKISTGKLTVDNDIIVKGSAVLNNGSTHSGDITVNGDLLKGSTVKLIDKGQLVTLNGGAVAGTISGIGRVNIDGSVDITQGKLTAEQVYLNGTLRHDKGWTLTKGQTLTLGGGKVAGNLIVAANTVLDYNGYTLASAPELKGGTLDMGGRTSITITGSKASVTLGKHNVNVTAKGTILTGDDLDVKGGTVTLTALDGYKGDLVAEGGSTLKISTGKLIVDNDIIVKGSAVLTNGSTHSGNITVNGDLLKGSTVKLIDKGQLVTLNSGAVNGTISGIGRVDVNGSVDITQGKLTAEQVYLNGTLTHAKGWTLTKGQTLTLGGGKMAGNLIVATGSVLDYNGYTLAAAPELKGGKLDMGGRTSITVTGSKASVTLGKHNVNVTAKGTILTGDDLDVKGGTVTLTALDGYKGDLVAEGGSTLKISTGKLAVDNDIIVKGSAVLNNGSTHSGDITVNGDLLKGSTIKLIDKGQLVTLNSGAVNGTISGIGRVNIEGAVDFSQGKLTAEQIYVNSGGRLANSKAWTLAKGQTLAFAGGSMEVGAKGLSTAAGSTLSLQQAGTLNGSLTLGGGELVYYGGNSPLTVTGTLTLSKATTLTMTGDLVKGKTYTLFKCNDIVTAKTFDAAAFFNNKDVVVNMEASAITVTYNGATKHTTPPSSLVREPEPEETEEAVGEDLPTRNALMATTAPAGTPAMAHEELPVVEEATVEAGRQGTVLMASEPQPEPMAAVADALVQADWGVVNAQHAFMGALNGRHQSLRAIGTGRTAVWADAIGSHTRQSSAHGHAGADSTLYGAAFGVEFNAGEHGAAGVAIGHTWDRVETFGMGRVKQDTQHAGAFGRARVFSRGANSLWLEAAAGYGKTESRATLGGDTRERWTQDGATLSVHANDVVQVGESTALNLFAGLEYLATDSGRIGSVHTGSVQNLRAELGGGVTHTVGRGMVFAEAALMGDMVRHNPSATIGGKYSGANPGRIGAGITVGGAYALGERWSLNASYTFQGAKHNNSHSVDLGASCRF